MDVETMARVWTIQASIRKATAVHVSARKATAEPCAKRDRNPAALPSVSLDVAGARATAAGASIAMVSVVRAVIVEPRWT